MSELKVQQQPDCLVSIIIPVYNVQAYLGDCLDSVLNQTERRIEIICVDDGSTDRSPAILEQYARRDSRIRVHRQANQGLSASRNAGFALARAPFILFVDSDDLLVPHAVEHCLAAALADSRTDVVLFDFQHTDEQGRAGAVFRSNVSAVRPGTAFTAVECPDVFFFYNSACSKFYRRAFLKEHRLAFQPGIWFEDLLFYLQLLLCHPVFYYLPELLYQYRQRGDSITKSFGSDRNRDILTVFETAMADYRRAGVWAAYERRFRKLAYDHIYTGILFLLAKAGRRDLFQEIRSVHDGWFPGRPDREIRSRLHWKKRIIGWLVEKNALFLLRRFP